MRKTDRERRGGKRVKSDWLGRLQRSARNAFELLREGRLVERYQADFEVVESWDVGHLRRYTSPNPTGPALLLVPPLMVTAEIYDISPELSAIARLLEWGVDVWLIDFGAPEHEDAGMSRTLDEHVLAVDRAIDGVIEHTGRQVHVAGYSQGGLFVYQVAAYRACKGIASLITMGSPVDMRRNLPITVSEELGEKILRGFRHSVSIPLDAIEGLPGWITSRGFKVVSFKKEIGQFAQLVGSLHDRDALARREPKRRFLGGEGFIAWPGPALRKFVDEVLAANRMTAGGFVIAGRTLSLSDIDVPILYFIGDRDDFARPRSVRPIRHIATHADCHETRIPAGHFGLVVGTAALELTWPRVVDWLEWQEGAEEPDWLRTPRTEAPEGGLRRGAQWLADKVWEGMGELSLEATGLADTIRWQLPRLTRMQNLRPSARFNIGRTLAKRANHEPNETFFIWDGRAYTFQMANRRVNRLAAALQMLGVGLGDIVGVALVAPPDTLAIVGALSRLGAIPLLLPIVSAGPRGGSPRATSVPGSEQNPIDVAETLRAAVSEVAPVLVVVDAVGLRLLSGLDIAATLRFASLGLTEVVSDEVAVLEELLGPATDAPPPELNPNPGRGYDPALILVHPETGETTRITNQRWMMSALAAAAACKLSPSDTVYCCLPMTHASAIMGAVGASLVAATRLALAPGCAVESFWPEVRRYGATVVFYSGTLCDRLVADSPTPAERLHSVRLFVGNGLSKTTWEAMLERFNTRSIIEYHAAAGGRVLLVNLLGDKVGSWGKPFVGSATSRLVRTGSDSELIRNEFGALSDCLPGQPGRLIVALQDGEEPGQQPLLEDPVGSGQRWISTNLQLWRDEEGDYWAS